MVQSDVSNVGQLINEKSIDYPCDLNRRRRATSNEFAAYAQ